MNEAVELTGTTVKYKKFGKFETVERFAFVLKFKGNKPEEVSNFYPSKDEAVLKAHLVLDEKIENKDNDFLSKLKEIVFIQITGVGETVDGDFAFESDDLETLVFGGNFKPIK